MLGSLARRLVPDLAPVSARERALGVGGAFAGILATGLLSRFALGDAELPLLIAPMGASAVLVFAAPASPLAQPWSLIGGNLVAAIVGVTAARLVPDPFLASAIAVCVAIALMSVLKCLHPPSGAVALTAVLSGPAISKLGYAYVVWPVLGNSLLLLVTALVFNGFARRGYPHLRQPKPRVDAQAGGPEDTGFTDRDLDAALENFGQLLDVDRGDLDAILRDAQLRAYSRRLGGGACRSIMTRNVVAIAPHAPLSEAFELLRQHHVKALPVTDESRKVLGIVTQTDLLDKASWRNGQPRLTLRNRFRLALTRVRAPHGVVEDIMTAPVRTLPQEAALAEVAYAMSASGLHHLPVVDEAERLVGIVCQTDLVAALIAEASHARAA